MALTIQPLGNGLGAEIDGIDPRAIGDADFNRLLHALAVHGVAILRDQRLTPSELLAFSRRFGEIEYHVLDQY